MKKVLIVDDSSYMRMFVKKIIKRAGVFIMFEASTKDDAIEMFKNAGPEIVILDLNMSETTGEGIQVLSEIMNINPEAVVIIISAVGYEDVKDECLELGAKGYIKKPFDTEDLLQILEEYK
ncbi:MULTISPECIES: response regulator [unclassified Clostridium]|uniref:response regulator n=1 Tax=unclassified Clostridium TaxID=2614128 RepID=UPI00029860B2|nr:MULTISPECIES: response regulator [unclassified Clostridium]EKQ56791.1 MAG: response regulator (CheY-like, AAA-type ATPase, and DNA-binding domain containing protein) [Clostridium sp. Maddingley MBC34-26]